MKTNLFVAFLALNAVDNVAFSQQTPDAAGARPVEMDPMDRALADPRVVDRALERARVLGTSSRRSKTWCCGCGCQLPLAAARGPGRPRSHSRVVPLPVGPPPSPGRHRDGVRHAVSTAVRRGRSASTARADTSFEAKRPGPTESGQITQGRLCPRQTDLALPRGLEEAALHGLAGQHPRSQDRGWKDHHKSHRASDSGGHRGNAGGSCRLCRRNLPVGSWEQAEALEY